MKTKRVIAPFDYLIQHSNLKYDGRNEIMFKLEKNCVIIYSREWLELNKGLTEEEVEMVNINRIVLIDELFVEVGADE